MPRFTRRILYPASVAVNSSACIFPGCIYGELPSPPIPSLPTEDPIPIDIKHSNRILPNFLIAAASVLAFSFFLLLLFYFLLRLRRRRRRILLQRQVFHPDAGGPHPLPTGSANGGNVFEDSFDGTHHIWFIRTVGLDEALIKSISARVYKSGDNSEDCSVCLGEFMDGETVKVLPRCKHWFHMECVDTWLKAHVNCPLCRAPILGEEVKLNELENGNLEIISLDLSPERQDGSSSSSRHIQLEDENEVQPTRRSVSMDASALGMLMIRVDLENGGKVIDKEEKGVELETVNNTDGVREMQRSMSSRSGRLFFPRYGRGRSTSVLPL